MVTQSQVMTPLHNRQQIRDSKVGIKIVRRPEFQASSDTHAEVVELVDTPS